jgi:hypothetical protein
LKKGNFKNNLNDSVFVENHLLSMQDGIGASQTHNHDMILGEDDLSSLLKSANTEIKMAQYRISRCVDDGEQHIVLTQNEPKTLQLTEKIPTSCRINLQGLQCPLVIYTAKKSKGDVSLYASFTNPEPSADSNEWSFWNERKVIISETLPKPPKPTKKDRFRRTIESEHKNFRA